MKILKAALVSVIVVSNSLTLSSAFAPSNASERGATFSRVSGSTAAFALSRHHRSSPSNKQRLTQRRLAAEDDEEDDADDEPLAKGIDSVSWLPTVIGARSEPISSVPEGSEILPLFPLGGLVYTPNSEHVLNIFEPRYRQMYNDILMNGTKRFVVTMSHPTEKGKFAQTGVLFELEDLKEVSEQTADQIKYICNHRVTGRVNLRRVVNPEAWESRDTYLKVEGTIVDDTGKDDPEPSNDAYGAISEAAKSAPQEEQALRESFADLVNVQHELEEDVRFTRASIGSLAVGPGAGEDGLWQTIRLWQNYADQRLMARQNELQADFQEKLQIFLKKEKGLKDEELPRYVQSAMWLSVCSTLEFQLIICFPPSAIGFGDLSPALQQEVKDLQKRMAMELQPLVLESTLTMQKILEAKDHKARCNLLRYFIDAERKRLAIKKSLKGMFDGSPTLATDDSSMPDEEKLDDTDQKSDSVEESASKPGSILTDEPDAFQ